jgi:hypothetical protein
MEMYSMIWLSFQFEGRFSFKESADATAEFRIDEVEMMNDVVIVMFVSSYHAWFPVPPRTKFKVLEIEKEESSTSRWIN